MLRLLQAEELSVAELQKILGMGQSRISMQLSQLKQVGLVDVRKVGQKSLYRLDPARGSESVVTETLHRSADEIPAAVQDNAALRLVLQKRKDRLRGYFDELAGRFGRHYMPGRNWKGLAEMLLKLIPPLVIADLGAGEGTVSLMLAQRAKRVIAVDHSGKMRAYALEVAAGHDVKNLDYRLGDLEALPIGDGDVDVALFHQSLHHALHPNKAIAEAWRILRPGGRLAVLDLLKHGVEEARDLYAHVWLGFSQVELISLLEDAGFTSADIAVVHREEEAPHFETLLAVAQKPAGA
jgi:ArsR family transcriptional regulator